MEVAGNWMAIRPNIALWVNMVIVMCLKNEFAEMRMLRWISAEPLIDIVRNDYNYRKPGLPPINGKRKMVRSMGCLNRLISWLIWWSDEYGSQKA